MTPGWAYALTIILTLDAPAQPPPSWHATLQDCRATAPVRVAHYELTGRPVSWVGCQRVRVAP